MKKFSLLLGTLGGAMAGYILSNDKLRRELSGAKDPEAAAKMLGAHLSKDGKRIAKEVKAFAESDDVRKNLLKAKTFAQKKFDEAQRSMQSLMEKGRKSAKSTGKEMAKQGKGFSSKKLGKKA